jgi:hypothetical protein
VTERFVPGDQRPASGDFVVLHGLRGADDDCAEHFLVRYLASDLGALCNKTIDARTLDPFRVLPKLLKGLVEPRDLVFVSSKWSFERFCSINRDVRALLTHYRPRDHTKPV